MKLFSISLAVAVATICPLMGTSTDAQTVTFLHSFMGGTNDAAKVLGTPASSGDTLFGVGTAGGANNQGVIFAISTNGADVQILHTYSGNGSDGCCPDGSVLLAGDTLYGTAGFPRSGQVFSVGTNGANYQVLHAFNGGDNDGEGPFQSTSLQIVGDTLYGVTDNGGSNNDGVVYSITTNGANFQVLHSFSGASDGEIPVAGLTLVGGTLYGTAQLGGSNDQGVVFSISTNGSSFQVVHTFTGGADGGKPGGSLTLVANTLYGLTPAGGSENQGTLFEILTVDNSFSVVRSFGTIGDDVSAPDGNVTPVGDTLYGAAPAGGKNSEGGIFSISTHQSDYGIVYSFAGENGGLAPGPNSELTLVGTNLFGYTFNGGMAGLGTLFTLDLGPGGSQPVVSNSLTFAFSNVVQTCKYKTKIDKALMTTNTTTNCTLSVEFIVSNTSTSTATAFAVLLWAEQGSTFDAGVGPFPAIRKIKALKEGKSVINKVKGTFSSNLSGTFIFATDTNLNVLASIPVE